MLRTFITYLKDNKYIIGILLLVLTIFFTNYIPNTYLMGWDSLQTELYPQLGVKRAFWSVWEEYQSFGLVSGMAHAADLVRAVFVWLISFVLPNNLVRYVFHCLMLFIGGWGMFVLLGFLGFKGKKQLLAFVGSVFYILNFGTAQIFGLPFEPFSIFFAFLPWEIWIFMVYVNSENILDRKKLLLMLLINLLATPQSYVQVLFAVYLMVLALLFLGMLIKNESKPFLMKKAFISFFLIILVNSFWILPQIYFLFDSYSAVKESKINQIATSRILNRNLEKGNILDFARYEGFYFESLETREGALFLPWKNYFNNFFIEYIRYVPFLLMLLGLFKSRKYHVAFLFLFALCTIALLNNEVGFSFINSFLRRNDFIGQIFRSPFTKFITLYSLVGSYLLVNGLDLLIGLFGGLRMFSVSSLLLIFIISFPTFTGNFFLSQMKTEIPSYYFELMHKLQELPKEGRVSLLPDYTYWGWFKSDWGYDGSGFLWYGAEQPIISRTFDVWSPDSESYYWEIKDAIEDQDTERFEKVLEKYNVSYLILDESLFPVSGEEESMQYRQIGNLLSDSRKIDLVQKLSKVSLYEIDSGTDNSLVTLTGAPNLGPDVRITDYDNAYIDLDGYVTSGSYRFDYYYPFLDLTSVARDSNRKWSISEDGDYVVLKINLDTIDVEEYDLILPEEILLDTKFLTEDQNIEKYTFEVDSRLGEDYLEVRLKKKLITAFDVLDIQEENCEDPEGSVSSDTEFNNLILKSFDGGTLCFGYENKLLPHWVGYMIKTESSNIKGPPLFFYVAGNKVDRHSKIEANLLNKNEYFLLNSGYLHDDGYEFSFQNTSYRGINTVNKLHNLEIYLFPYKYIKNIKLVRKKAENSQSTYYSVSTSKTNYYTYKVEGRELLGRTLVLNQSYNGGWVAFCGLRSCGKHVKVNNWANGWVFDKRVSEDVSVIFWPQYLEYLGFILLLVPFLWVVRIKEDSE